MIIVSDDLRGRLLDLALAHRLLEFEGHGDLTLGHVSMRDPEGRGFWLKPQGVGLCEIRDVSQLMLLDFDGERLHGEGWMHSEWPIHSEIYLARPDVGAVGHTHPYHACLFSATGETLRAVAHEGSYFNENVPYFRETSDLVNTKALGRSLAAALGDAHAVLMANHGVTFCGASVARATMMGIFLEKACRAQLDLHRTGLDWKPTPPGPEMDSKERLLSDRLIAAFWDYECRRLEQEERARGVSP